MYKHYPAWALKHGLACMLVLFSSLPPLNTRLKVHLGKWEQWPFFRMFYSRNKDLGQRMKKVKFPCLVFTLWSAVKGYWCFLLSYPPVRSKGRHSLWCLYVLISYASKQTNKQKLRTNYSKESKCHLKWFLLCNLTEPVSCHRLGFPTPSRVARSTAGDK